MSSSIKNIEGLVNFKVGVHNNSDMKGQSLEYYRRSVQKELEKIVSNLHSHDVNKFRIQRFVLLASSSQ